MTVAYDGLWGWLVIFVLAAVIHEPWRWLGYALGRRLNPNDEIFKWVKYVSTSLIAALVARLILFPAGALSQVTLELRLFATVAGVGLFLATGKLWQGVCFTALLIGLSGWKLL